MDRYTAIQETAWYLPWQSVQALIQMLHWVSNCYKPEVSEDNRALLADVTITPISS